MYQKNLISGQSNQLIIEAKFWKLVNTRKLRRAAERHLCGNFVEIAERPGSIGLVREAGGFVCIDAQSGVQPVSLP
jgi:hypothetical protein